MKLVPLEQSDLALYTALFTDPVYMNDLGGPQPAEKVPGMLNKQIECHNSGKGIVLKIVPEEEDWLRSLESKKKKGVIESDSSFYDFRNDPVWKDGIGSVCLWFYGDTPEIGYGVLPKYQNYGFTSTAVQLLIEKAREEKEKWKVIHVMTAITNIPSIRLLQKLRFTFLETCEMDYDDRKIPANHYIYDLNG